MKTMNKITLYQTTGPNYLEKAEENNVNPLNITLPTLPVENTLIDSQARISFMVILEGRGAAPTCAYWEKFRGQS